MMNNKLFRNLWLPLYSFFCRTKCAYRGGNGKTVKILANGPSLKDDLNNLVETDSVSALNFFCLNEVFWSIKPNHYVLADPAFFRLETPADNVVRLYEAIGKIDWEIIFYVPLRFYSVFKDKVKSNTNVVIKTFYRFPFMSENTPKSIERFLYKHGWGAPSAQNVLIPSIFLMINEGYEKIYLYGTDHSWISQMAVNDENQVCLIDRHFYDNKEPIMKPWLTETGKPFKMHDLMKIFYKVFLNYHKLHKYAMFLGNIRIINMTKDSFIDSFERP